MCYLPDRRSGWGETEPAGGEGRFQEQGHSFSPYGPTLPVNNRFIFFTQNNKTPSNAALCHFNFLLKTFLN